MVDIIVIARMLVFRGSDPSMCGLTGFIDAAQATSVSSLEADVGSMLDTLRHRGPDAGGVWFDAAAGISVGFRRLAIVDLSPAGHQPMHSPSGRYVLVFNGEVYNYREVRRELETCASGETPTFRGHSDTEVMLAAIDRWGVDEAIKRLVGMFAFALWDRKERLLYLGRDRMGEKPLYYGWMGNTFLFGSELKALRSHPAFHGEIDRHALDAYLRLSYVPAPWSIYRGVHKLPPGTVLRLDPRSPGDLPTPVPYWSVRQVAEQAVSNWFDGDEVEATDRLDGLLRQAVGMQMVADVPLGAFLSGGIDSSTVVAMMQAQSERPVKTFTIGSDDAGYNEAAHARTVAQHLGTDHTELYVTPSDAMGVIPQLPFIYDEPFGDQSQIPTFLVSRLARTDVTVSLSGDGGDELFAGYRRYFWTARTWRRVGWAPPIVRRGASTMLASVPVPRWDQGFDILRPAFPSGFSTYPSEQRIHRMATLLGETESPESLYRWMISSWEGSAPILNANSQPAPVSGWPAWPDFANLTQSMLCFDLVTYLPDDILVKVDRASMAVSLESRAPFLDHRVVEFAMRVPPTMKMRNGQGKWLLRRVLERYVPRDLFERPKMGFGIPIGQWLHGPLRDWAEDLLQTARLRDEACLDVHRVRDAWNEYLAGHSKWEGSLWNVLMYQAWLSTSVKEVSRHPSERIEEPFLGSVKREDS